MNGKKYVNVFLLLVGIFFWGNVALWYGYTKFCFGVEGHGDVTRMAFLTFRKAQTPPIKYEKTHIEFMDYLQMEKKPDIDILTIGDSFSNGGGGSYYQDYMVNKYDEHVLNIPMMEDGNPLTVLSRLLDSRMMEEIKPRVVIIESVERLAAARFSTDNTSQVMSKDEFIKYYNGRTKSGKNDFTGILPVGMIKVNWQMFMAKVNNYGNENRLSLDVYKEMMSEELFTNKEREKMLLFYRGDLWCQDANIDFSKIEYNLSKAAVELHKRNIQMVVMVNVDKLDLYRPYIVNLGKYAENKFMEDFSNHVHDYIFINTKEILREMLAEDEKDVYWQDDTHWTWKAQQRVVDVLMTKIK